MYTYTPDEIANLSQRLAETRERISPEFRLPTQVLGKRRTLGCVALEITQRCNLDCSICYLSENSESTPDIPLETIFRRIDRLQHLYGVGTNIQITGGDPTLRDHDELERIVAYIVERKMVPALFTNGIYATRELLERLARAGLVDVAFHVDLTEKRLGYSSEVQLNEVRQEYVERARGLKLNVIFNQTVFSRNFKDLPEMVRFYKRNADVIGMASFQLQADTGRGFNRKRKDVISIQTVRERIAEGLGTSLAWDSVRFGHPDCHVIGYAAIIGQDVAVDMIDDDRIIAEFQDAFDGVYLDRRHMRTAVLQGVRTAITRRWGLSLGRYFARRVRENWRPILKHRGNIRKLSFFIQNFQDAENLDHQRIDNCSFHCTTNDAAVSMCVHNAYRDHYLQGGTGYPEEYQRARLRDGFHPTEPRPLRPGEQVEIGADMQPVAAK